MRLALLGMFALSLIKGCDLKQLRPEQVGPAFQKELRPYFVNAQAAAIPEQHIILGLTCIEGAGPALREQAKTVLDSNEDLKSLQLTNALGPLIGNNVYRYAAVGFDTGIVALDVESGQTLDLQPWEGYDTAYRDACKLGVSRRNVAEQGPYLFVGHFTVTLAKPFRGRKQISFVDGLGLYSGDSDFESHRQAELRAREQLILADLTERNMEPVTVRLDSVEKVGVPAHMRAD